MITDKEILEYIKTVERRCPQATKDKIRAELEDNLYSFREENPNADMAAAVKRFGTPEDYAAGFAQAMSAEEQVKAMSKAAAIRKTAVVTAIAIVAIFAAVMIGMWIDAHSDFHGQTIISPVEEVSSFDEVEFQ
ncbi:MAG: hypothetical protein IJN38_03360 [Clostridia bacterium]|nr:hypothetical protein [Clostridia bacterium]